jgi:hypothetical protein
VAALRVFSYAKPLAERVLLIIAQYDCGQRQHIGHLQRDGAFAE